VEELADGCRRIQNEELHNSYESLNVIRVVKSKNMNVRSIQYVWERSPVLQSIGLGLSSVIIPV